MGKVLEESSVYNPSRDMSQREIHNEFNRIIDGVNTVGSRVESVEDRVDSIEDIMKVLCEQVAQLNEKVDKILTHLGID